MAVVKDVIDPGEAIAGGEISFSITITNNGMGYATMLELTDVLPDGLEHVSNVPSAGTSFDPDTGIWTVGTLIPLASATLDLTVELIPIEGICAVDYVNNVGVTAQGQTDLNLSDNADDATALLVSIAAAKTLGAGTPIDQGDGTYQISYVLLVRNNGGSVLNNVQVVDDLQALINTPIENDATIDPASVTITTPDPTFTLNPAYDGTSDTNLLLGTDTLAPGAEGTIEITFTLTPHVFFGRFENQATVSAVTENGTPVSDLSEDGASISTVFSFGTPQSNHDNCIVDSPTVFQLDIPTTPITLGWLKSSDVGGGQVLFEWSTEAEVGNVGYYLWSQDASGEWTKLNEAMIESQGDSLTVQDYSYHAYGVTGNSLRITDVDLHGKQVHHGPYQLGEEVGVRSERKAIDWDSINRESEELRRQREQQQLDELNRRLQGSTETQSLRSRLGGLLAMLGSALISPVQATELVNIDVDRAGIYRVTHAQLLDANLDLTGTPNSAIGLKTGNELTPMKLHTTGSSWGAGAYIEFAGRSVETLYTGTNIYTVVLNEGQVLIGTDDRAIPDGPAAYSYLDEVVYAEQNEYTHFSPDKDDAWYADRL
ncbi:MAG: DUF11 domain-containing protein, partial [Methylococcales bacterium]|nr:DUF11 domain-containing protein [Methylococcales bacterium]